MAQPYIGEIRMFAGSFAPAGWMFCDGALLPISENDALFTLIGTTYGGDGQETFALPNLKGRLPLHQGTLSGNSNIIGQSGGVEQVTLTTSTIPVHTHPFLGTTAAGTSKDPKDNMFGTAAGDVHNQVLDPLVLSPTAVVGTGGSQPHENMQPFTCVSFIISLFGVFPTQ